MKAEGLTPLQTLQNPQRLMVLLFQRPYIWRAVSELESKRSNGESMSEVQNARESLLGFSRAPGIRSARRRAALFMSCGLFVLSSCGGSSQTAPTLAPLTSEEALEIALPYFENFALNTAGGFDRMKALTTESSPARRYYQHQRYLVWAGGGSTSAWEVRNDGQVIKLCGRLTMFDNSCASYTKYSNFVISKDRTKVKTFDIQDEPLDGRFGVVSQEFDCLTWNKSDCGPEGESLVLEVLTVLLNARDSLVLTYRSSRGSRLNYGDLRVAGVKIVRPDGSIVSSKDFSKGMPSRGKEKYGYALFTGLRSAFSSGQELDGELVLQWANSSRAGRYKFKIRSSG